MKALVWHGTTDIRCDTVADPKIEDERDPIIKVTSCAICGSDLHLYDHFMPGMRSAPRLGRKPIDDAAGAQVTSARSKCLAFAGALVQREVVVIAMSIHHLLNAVFSRGRSTASAGGQWRIVDWRDLTGGN